MNHEINETLIEKIRNMQLDKQLNLFRDLVRFRELYVLNTKHEGKCWINLAKLAYKQSFQEKYDIDHSHEFSSLYCTIK